MWESEHNDMEKTVCFQRLPLLRNAFHSQNTRIVYHCYGIVGDDSAVIFWKAFPTSTNSRNAQSLWISKPLLTRKMDNNDLNQTESALDMVSSGILFSHCIRKLKLRWLNPWI